MDEKRDKPDMAKDIGDLILRVDQIERDHKDLKTEYHIINKVLDDLEKEVKDQREDYHAHIRQFVEENVASHKEMNKRIVTYTDRLLMFEEIYKTHEHLNHFEKITALETALKALQEEVSYQKEAAFNRQSDRD